MVLLSLAVPGLLLLQTAWDSGSLDLEPWRNVLGDLDRWGVLLGNTGIVLLTAAVVSLPAALGLAFLLFRTDLPFRGLWIALLVLAAAFPLYIVHAAAVAITGLTGARGSRLTVGLIHGVAHLPLLVLVLGLVLRSVRRDLEESALLEGSSPLRVLVSVTLRQAAGGLAVALVVLCLLVTTDHTVSDLLQVRTFAEEVNTQFALEGRPQEPTLVGLPWVLLLGALLFALRGWFLGSAPLQAWRAPLSDGAPVFRLGAWRVPAAGLVPIAVLSLVLVPVTLLLSRLESPLRLLHFAHVFSPEIRTTVWTSFTAGALCAVLGCGLAWCLVRRPRWRLLLALYVVALLAFPAPLIGIGLIQLLNRPGLPGMLLDSPLVLILAYTVRFLPVAMILMVPAVRALPLEVETAARLDGASGLRTYWQVVSPLCLRAMGLSLFVVAILSLGELPCSQLLAPPGYTTVSARFFSLVHYGLDEDWAALCLFSVLAIGIPYLGVLFLVRTFRRRLPRA
jgi:iron(III) transport system permease protein